MSDPFGIRPADVERMREYANESGKDSGAAEGTGESEGKAGDTAGGAGSTETEEERWAGQGVEAAH